MRKVYPAQFKNCKFLAVFLLTLLGSLAHSVFGQSSSYSTPGTYTFTVPAGVTSMTVSTWGAGGAGGGVNGQPQGGGGGEGGSFVRGTLTVVPGATYTVVVGTGGVGALAASGPAGQSSTVSVGGGGPVVFNAIGGVGGTGNSLGAGGNAANNGNVVSGTVTSNFYGGNGGNGTSASSASSGGGGGSAGAGGAGGNGGSPLTVGAAGIGSGAPADAGAAGGIGRGSTNDGNGNNGNAPGAGGGGARNANDNIDYKGGNGGNGQVIIYFTCPTYSITGVSAPAICQGATASVTLTGSAASLPVGTYTVTYNTSAPNAATGLTATITVTTAGTGNFTTPAFVNSGTTTITITKLSSGSAPCNSTISSGNTTNLTVNAPTVAVGGAVTAICQSGTTAALGGSFGGTATAAVWSDGGAGGSFTNNGGTTPSTTTYTAAAGAPATVTLTLTTSGGSCGTTSATKNVTVNKTPTVSVGGATAAICQNATSAALGGSFGGGATAAIWSDGGAGGTFTLNGGTTPGTTTYKASLTAPAIVTLTLLTSGGSCGTATASKTVTINPLPTVNVGGAMAAICQGGTSAALGGSFGGGATAAVWSDGGAGGTFANNAGGTPGTATYTASATAPATVTLTLLTSGGSCSTTSLSKTITVNKTPTVNVGGATVAICQGGTSAALGGSFGGGATLAVWSDGGAGGTFANNGGTTPNTATYSASTSAPSSVTLTLTSGGGSCGTTFLTKTITVNPTAVVSAGGAVAAVCQGGTTAALDGSFSGGATAAIWSDGGAGGTFTGNGGATPNTATYTASATSTTPVTLTLTTSGGSCGIVSDSKTLIVNANPTVNAGGALAAICQGGTTTALGGSFGGGATAAVWSDGGAGGSFTDNTGATPNTATYTAAAGAPATVALTLTTIGGSCGVISDTKNVTVYQSVTIITNPGPLTQTICAASNVSYSVVASGTGLTYQWLRDGNPISNGGRISGATSSTLNITGATVADDGTYSVLVSGLSPCASATSDTAHLDVDQKVTFTAQPVTPQTICEGQPYTVFVTATGTVGLYQWYKNGSPFAAGTFDGANTYTLTIPAVTLADNGSSYRLLLDDGSGVGCSSANSNVGTLTVRPTPIATISGTTEVCQNTAAPLVTFGNPQSLPVTITYDINGAGTFTINVAANSTSTVATPTGTTGTFNYNLVSVAYQSGADCSNPITSTATITVNPLPTITPDAAATDICVSPAAQTTQLAYSATTEAPTSYSITWNASPSNSFAPVINAAFPASPITINVPAGTAPGTYTGTITVKNANGCVSNTGANFTVTVIANSTITLSSAAGTDAQTKCINTPITNITYAIGGSGTGASLTAGSLPAGVTGVFNAGVFTISGTPTVAGSFNYTVTTTGPCANPGLSGTITVNDDATIALTSPAPTTSQTICVSTPLTAITYQIGGGGTGATISGLPAGITGAYNAGTQVYTISGTPTATGTFNYTVTTTGPCVKPITTGTILVQANSTITLSSGAGTNNQTRCINVAMSNITFTIAGGGTGATVTGLPAGVNGVFNAGVFTISGTPSVAGTFNYTVTTVGPCVNPTATGTITVNDDATIVLTSAAATTSQTLCVSTPLTAITYQIGGGGTGATVSGLPAGVTGAYNSGTKVFTISGTPTVTGTFNYTVSTTGPCVKPTSIGSITVQAGSVLTRTSAAATTAQTVCINTAITNITYSVTGGGTGASITAGALPAGVTGTFAGGVFTISGTPTVSGAFSYTVTTAGPCTNQSLSGTITVNDNATITFTSAAGTDAQTLCISTPLTAITYAIGGLGTTGATVSGLPTGVSGIYNSGTKVFTISGTPTVSGTFSYTVSTTGPCIKPIATGSILVQAGSVLTRTSAAATTAQTVCINSAITTITYSVTGGGTGASITAGALPAGVTGTFAGGVFTISGTPTVSGSFSYTVTTTGPCTNQSLSGTITVNDNATIIFTSAAGTDAQTLCISTPLTAITYAIGGFGTTGATVSGLPTGVTGAYNSGTKVFTISGTPTVSGTFNYTVSTTGPCIKPTATGSIIVQPNSVLTRTSSTGSTAQTVCINNAITNITYSVTGSGTGASITAGALPAGVTGTFAGGVFTISGTPTVSGAFSYTVTTVGPCLDPSLSGTITVNADATIAFTSAAGTNAQTKCINTAITPITYAIGGGGTGATTTGLPTGVNGSYNSGTKVYTISGTPSVSGTFNYTVTSSGPCIRPALSGTIIVTPNATLTLTSAAATKAQTICNNTVLTAITYAVAGSGTGATVTGLPAGVTGSFAAGIFTITGTPSVTGTFNYSVTTSGPCAQDNETGTITVLSTPTGTLTASETSGIGNNDNTICIGSTVTFSATPGFGSYIFRVNGTQVQAGTANTWSSSTLANGASVTVDVANALNCGNTFGPIVITANLLPAPTLVADKSTICKGDLVTFTATGGTSYTFKVNGAPVQISASGTYQANNLNGGDAVTVDATNANGCTATSSAVTMIVNPLPAGTLSATATEICSGGPVTFTASGSFSNYEFFINGASVQSSATKTYTTNFTDPSVVMVRVTNNATGCSNFWDTLAINVNALPSGILTASENSGVADDNSICAGTPVNFTATAGFVTYQFMVNGVIKQTGGSNTYSNSALVNNDVVTVKVSSGTGCEATFPGITITVAASPTGTLIIAPSATICVGDNVTFTATSGYDNYTFVIGSSIEQNGTDNTFSTSSLANGDVVTVEVTNSNTCVKTFNPIIVTVNPLPTATLVAVENSGNTSNDGITCTGATITFTAPTGFANYNFLLNGISVQNGGANTFVRNNLVTGNKVEVAVSNSNNCIALSNAITVTVNPIAAVSPITGTLSVCVGGTTTLSDPTSGGIWSSLNPGIASIDAAGIVTGVAGGTATIRYTVSNTNGCDSTVTATVTVNALPVVSAIGGPGGVCVSSTITLTDATTGGTWSSSDNLIASISATGVVTGVASGSVTITYSVTNGNGCTTAVTKSVTVNVLPVLTAITGNVSLCVNTTSTLSSTPSGGVWTSDNKPVATVNATTGVVTAVSAGTTNITYTVTSGAGCVASVSTVVTVNPLPVPTLTGKNPICLNDNEKYVTEPGQTNYVWHVIGGTITGGGTAVDDTIQVTWTTASAKSITVNYSNSFGCTAATSSTFTNAPTTTPPSFVSGVSAACVNATGNVYTTQSGHTDYTWTVNGGTIESGGTDTDDAVTITWTSTGIKSVSINYSDAFGCNAVSAVVYPVTVNPLPTATISGTTTTVCQGSTAPQVIFTGANGTSPYTFTYTINGGSLQTIVSTDDFATITVSTATPGVFTYDLLSVKDASSTTCSQAQTGTATVTVSTTPNATIAYTGGPFCTSAAPVPVVQTGTTGGTYSSTTGLTIAANGTITPATSTGGTYTVTYTVAAVGGCSVYTTTTNVTITTAPSAVISYAGGPFCTSSSPITVTRAGTAGGNYTADLPGLTINATTGTITPATSTNGTYTVTYAIPAASGCAAFSTTASVTITNAPTATISYSGTPFCRIAGTAPVTRTGTAGGSYTATPAGLSIDGTTGTITPGTSAAGAYVITYTITGTGGCSNFTTTANVTITAAPTAVAGTAITTCTGAGAVNITAGSSAANQSSVLWTSNGTGTFTDANSLTLASYTPSAADIAAGSRTLTLTVNGNGNCAAVTSTKTITISATTPMPAITASPSTVCIGSSGNLVIASGTTTNLINENFNGTSTFTVASTGTNQAAASWTSRTSTYTYNYGFFSSVSFNSGSKFMLANSDDGGGSTNTALVSPVVSSVGYSSLNLSYRTYFRKNSNETAVVEVSTNGGTSWTTQQSITATTGSANNFSTQIVNLNAYINNASLRIRFRYSGNNEYWWAIDDVVLTGSLPSFNFSWTASPAATAGLPAGAGTSSAANSNIVVTPTATGSYTYTAALTNGAGCTTTQPITITVNPLPTISISVDYCITPGKVHLTANSVAGVSYVWSTGQTTQSIDVDIAGNYDVSVSLPGGCPATASVNVANELVTNGNFTAGNTGFTSDYAYKPDIAGNTELIDDSGNNGYSITTSGQNVHTNFWGADHTQNTSGAKNFMAVNGHGNTLVVWKQTVTVQPNTTYYFSAWAMSLNSGGSYAQLRFSVNGALVGTTAALAAHGESAGSADNWTRFYGTWTSGPTITSADIYINDLQAALGGNDFGIDDVSFGTLSTFINLESAAGTDAQTVCKGSPITDIRYSVGNGSPSGPTVTGLPAGVTSTFTGDLIISGTPTAPGGIYTYSITTTGGCNPTTVTGTITVQEPTITLSAGSTLSSVCLNSPVSVSFTLGGTATGASVTGLPPGVTGSLSGTTYTISGSPTSAAASPYAYTITTTGTCPPQATISGTITVQIQSIVLNTIPATAAQTVCINTPITTIRYAVAGMANNASASGLPPGVTGTFSGGFFNITGSPTSSAGSPYTYTVTTSGPSCTPTSMTGTITVTPAATLTLTSAVGTNTQNACNNLAITPITYAVNGGTNASITSGAFPAGVTGSYSAGVYTISGTPTAGGVFNYTISTTGGCGTGTTSGTITVNAQTIVLSTGSTSPSLCSGTVMTNIVYTIGGTATGATVSGLPTGVSASLSGNVFTISGTPTGVSGAYPYTVTTLGTCDPKTATGTITISPVATGGSLTGLFACSNTSGSLTLSGQSGTINRWESSTNGGTTWTTILPNNTTITQAYTNITVPTLYRVVVGNGCGSVFSTQALVGIHNYWTGTVSNVWGNGANWSDGAVPTLSCPDVVIPAGTPFSPVLATGTATVNNLIIKPSATLTVTGAILQIAGTVTSAGGLNAGSGTVVFNGTAPQTIAGTAFSSNNLMNLTMSNASGLTVTSGAGNLLNISGVLSFGSVSNATLHTGDNVVLTSTASGTARVADVTNNDSNTGNKFDGIVTVQRYFPSRRAWRLFTAPVSAGGNVFNNWQNGGVYAPGIGTYVSGSTAPAGGLDVTPLQNSSLKATVALTPVLNTLAASLSRNVADTSDNIPYFIFVRGDRDYANTNPYTSNITTLSSKGKLQTGRQTFPADNTAEAFTIVGNPYASPVDLSKIGLNNIPRRFWVWDPYINIDQGAYVVLEDLLNTGTYTATPPTTLSKQALQSGQAFFVQTDVNGPASVVFQENCKSNVSNLVSFRPMGEKMPAFRVNFYHLNENDSTQLLDGVFAQFDSQFSKGVDLMDAIKATNIKEMLALKRDSKSLSVERRPVPTGEDTLYLQVRRTTQRNYRFVFEPSDLDPGLTAYLVDNYTGKKVALSVTANSVRDFSVNGDAASAAVDRFSIVFKQTPVLHQTTRAYQLVSNIAVEWTIENEINVSKYEVEKSSDDEHYVKVATVDATGNDHSKTNYSWLDVNPASGDNFYRIRRVSPDGSAQYGSVVSVNMGKLVSGIRIYPNPVTNGIIGAEFKNMEAGIYSSKLLNNAGQTIFGKSINHVAGTSMEYIKPDYNLPSGIYQLEITSPDKKTTKVKVIIK